MLRQYACMNARLALPNTCSLPGLDISMMFMSLSDRRTHDLGASLWFANRTCLA